MLHDSLERDIVVHVVKGRAAALLGRRFGSATALAAAPRLAGFARHRVTAGATALPIYLTTCERLYEYRADYQLLPVLAARRRRSPADSIPRSRR